MGLLALVRSIAFRQLMPSFVKLRFVPALHPALLELCAEKTLSQLLTWPIMRPAPAIL